MGVWFVGLIVLEKLLNKNVVGGLGGMGGMKEMMKGEDG